MKRELTFTARLLARTLALRSARALLAEYARIIGKLAAVDPDPKFWRKKLHDVESAIHQIDEALK